MTTSLVVDYLTVYYYLRVDGYLAGDDYCIIEHYLIMDASLGHNPYRCSPDRINCLLPVDYYWTWPFTTPLTTGLLILSLSFRLSFMYLYTFF